VNPAISACSFLEIFRTASSQASYFKTKAVFASRCFFSWTVCSSTVPSKRKSSKASPSTRMENSERASVSSCAVFSASGTALCSFSGASVPTSSGAFPSSSLEASIPWSTCSGLSKFILSEASAVSSSRIASTFWMTCPEPSVISSAPTGTVSTGTWEKSSKNARTKLTAFFITVPTPI